MQKFSFTIFVGIFLFSIPQATAQEIKIESKINLLLKDKSKNSNSGLGESEKSIAVDAKVNVSMCVSSGKLKINGWDRNEIRAYVNGSAVGFKVLQKNKNSQPVWVMIVGFDTTKKPVVNGDECLSGDDIEIDLPRSATIDVKNDESETTINSVSKAIVKNVGGSIFLNGIERGVDATAYEGDITVEKSGGSINLSGTTGNIIAFDLAPSEIGDTFKAKTNSGAITLQNIEHRQMEISTNAGAMRYTGEFQTNGQYRFGTQNGSILLLIPEASSCKVNATYGFGTFNSEIQLQNIIKNAASKTKSLIATMGAGEASLNLTTFNGTIRIRKK